MTDSRQLSVTAMNSTLPTSGSSENTTTNLAMLFYENIGGKTTVLLHRTLACLLDSTCECIRKPNITCEGTVYHSRANAWVDISGTENTSLSLHKFRSESDCDSTTLYDYWSGFRSGTPFTSGRYSLFEETAGTEVLTKFYSPSESRDPRNRQLIDLAVIRYHSSNNNSSGCFVNGKHSYCSHVLSNS